MGKLLLIVPLLALLKGNLFSSVSRYGISPKNACKYWQEILIQGTKCCPRKPGSSFSLCSSTAGPGSSTTCAPGFAHGKVCSPEAAPSSAMHISAAHSRGCTQLPTAQCCLLTHGFSYKNHVLVSSIWGKCHYCHSPATQRAQLGSGVTSGLRFHRFWPTLESSFQTRVWPALLHSAEVNPSHPRQHQGALHYQITSEAVKELPTGPLYFSCLYGKGYF